MVNVKVQIFFTVFAIKKKKLKKDCKTFWINDKYTLYTYEMNVKVTDIR